MNKAITVILVGISVSVVVGLLVFINKNTDVVKSQDRTIEITNESNFLFKAFVNNNDYTMQNGQKIWNLIRIEPDPARQTLYEKLGNPKNTVVVLPIFTATAYKEPGFYTYYREECNESCLTRPIVKEYRGTSSVEAIQVFRILNYTLITDLDIDQHPDILNRFDKVVMLHSEYVTKKEFDAITNHPKVVFLYPNALYAEVKVNQDNTITLLRGHNYPDASIRNAFDWPYDNSALEYDADCSHMRFSPIPNGMMLNCFPENEILANPELLQLIKDF